MQCIHYAFAFFPQGLLWCTLVSHQCGSVLLCAAATPHEGAVCNVMSPCVRLSCIVTVCDMYCHHPCANPKMKSKFPWKEETEGNRKFIG